LTKAPLSPSPVWDVMLLDVLGAKVKQMNQRSKVYNSILQILLENALFIIMQCVFVYICIMLHQQMKQFLSIAALAVIHLATLLFGLNSENL
jgi:hypothetical protein